MARTRSTETESDVKTDEVEGELSEDQKRYREEAQAEREQAERQRKMDEERGEKLMAEAPDPENPDDQEKFTSLITRDTTHFQNVHYDGTGPTDKIAASSSAQRVELLQHLLLANGFQVNPGTGWDYATQKAVMEVNDNGEVDRDTWNKLSDALFADDKSGGKEPKPATVPQGS